MLKDFLRPKKSSVSEELNRANALFKKQKFKSAAKIYRRILKENPTHFAACANLAVCLFEEEDFAASIPFFEVAAEQDSANPWWDNYLSQACQKTGDFERAIQKAFEAVVKSGGAPDHHLNLTYALYETSEEKGRDFIESILRKWAEMYPDSGIVKQAVAAFETPENFEKANPEYVEKLFDVFAPDFETVLKELGYKSPEMIAEKTARFWKKNNIKNPLVLDLGCGSGLFGIALKKKIKNCRIFGVDMSSKMLSEAAAKNVYEGLKKDEIIHYLETSSEKFETIIAADVLTYFGKLDSLMEKVSDSLKKNGLFAFTISENTASEKDYVLMPSSRFVHAPKYVEKLLLKNGFDIVSNEQKTLRKEGDKNVLGRLILARRK